MCFCIKKIKESRGQATVEGAFLIPVLFVLLLLLIQPGILLYNHMVMQAAAQEGCRLLATKTTAYGESDEKYKGYILRRLGAIPPQDNFHIHQDVCSWEIELQGDESSEYVQVGIKNKVKFLPLLGGATTLLGITDEKGVFTQEVNAGMSTQPNWLTKSAEGFNPQAWIGKWSQ